LRRLNIVGITKLAASWPGVISPIEPLEDLQRQSHVNGLFLAGCAIVLSNTFVFAIT
jgi:hypothetical protein